MVLLMAKESIRLKDLDINKRLYSQFSDSLIEVLDCVEHDNFVDVKIKSDLLDEKSLKILWEYALNNFILN